ncbi:MULTISPECIES: heavy metal translocating P-type ATPase [Caldilinea]|jgi:Cd2+/Zn2+-exporting ATPase/Cu+-exporting ATPase|uniref:Copper-transporting ATPase CopA n=1 Tax=Caldilinea aerophila (strain DSM 14535 / JCM 11387 / NBRC 104270 / STL-6-O1) TaxID=926550 RepID=I0I8W1_CALAS|nr:MULTISPECIES: cation-translocating P-type ATPase [Caldilinea]MBO9394102.1 cadmium-translocating P-type ATPase [Caldilinea sp.]BAM01699.1 copper-transporting ATPase CopA [Caldilinea aerophila DSM 14535 = NBRC 104270]GIV73037.1 MAG: copper-translocating P-type ATPase [Caldilinea sp.]
MRPSPETALNPNPHRLQTLELPVHGMDCAECARHVEDALAKTPGVASVQVLLSAEKAILQVDPAVASVDRLRAAVAEAGYIVPEPAEAGKEEAHQSYTRKVWTLLALVFGAVLFVVVIGEWLGLFERITARVPFVLGATLVALSGWPVFANVARAARKRQVTSHTLMTLGVIAALAVGEWATAAVVVFFMRVGDFVERFTAEGARTALRDLTALAPRQARVVRNGVEQEIPVEKVTPGDLVVVRPGEQIPVDGVVVEGHATVDQATITGEPLPVEVEPGSRVFAATIARLGSLRIRTERVGADTTFGRVVRLVQEAESNRAEVQRFADRFSAYYLPVVITIAALTLLIRRDPLAMAAVLVVACSCSIALATPVAMLAAIGRAAREGILIKGGRYIEALARADVLLLDKTGTLTFGRPQIERIIPFNGVEPTEALRLAASAERDSEHPLAEAVRACAARQGLHLSEPTRFEAIPGKGVFAEVEGHRVAVGSHRLLDAQDASLVDSVNEVRGSVLWVLCDGKPIAALVATDTLRPETPLAIQHLREMGIPRIELLTGDNANAAAALAGSLGIPYRADLLPEDKITIVRNYQREGKVVVMVGDGVNDAPALAQADVGVAMGAAGADIALEAAHVALMREDWMLVPALFAIARRTLRIVKMNLLLTALYNAVGLSLAAAGLLPPILAAAAQSIPDLFILGNSARLLKSAPYRSPSHDSRA